MSPELQAALTHLLNQVNTVGDQMPLALSEYLKWCALESWLTFGVVTGIVAGLTGFFLWLAQEDRDAMWWALLTIGIWVAVTAHLFYDLYGIYYAPHAYLVHNLLKVG